MGALVIVIFSGCLLLVRAQTDCAQTLNSCIATFRTAAGLDLDNYGVPIPFKSGATAEGVCSAFSTFKQCTTFNTECMINQQKTMEGMWDAYNFICASDDSQADYERHGACLGGSSQVTAINGCINSLNDGLIANNFCSKVSTYYDCLGDVTGCEEAAVTYLVQHYRRQYEKQSERYKCGTGGAGSLSGTTAAALIAVVIAMKNWLL